MPAEPTPPPPERWLRCPQCHELVYYKRFSRCLRVCPSCGHHARLTAPQRLEQLLDHGSPTPVEVASHLDDPLGFADARPYAERLRETRRRTGLSEAAICVRGLIEGHPLVAVVMDFRFLGGSLGCGVGESIAAGADIAARQRIPLLFVTASGGARMQEGTLALMQLAKTSQAMAMLDEAGCLTVALVTDPTYGGVAASFATQSDLIIAEPGAHLGFAGPRVIEQTIRRRLPGDFQVAERLAGQGLIDAVHPRPMLRHLLARVLATACPGRTRPAPAETRTAAAGGPARLVRDARHLAERDSWLAVQVARDTRRPTTLDYVNLLLDDFHELHGDRVSADCPAVVAGLGRFDGRPVALIGQQKGHTTRELLARNFGMPSPAGYRKAARVVRLADKLRIPIITLIDTPGAYPGPEAEQDGQAWAIADSLRLMFTVTAPVVAVVTGEGGSGGALAFGIADRVLMLENAVYSVISAEGCAAILWKDAALAPQAARALRLDARNALRLGIVDAVIPEPADGAQSAPAEAADLLGDAIRAMLAELGPGDAADAAARLAARRRRFRQFGTPAGHGTAASTPAGHATAASTPADHGTAASTAATAPPGARVRP